MNAGHILDALEMIDDQYILEARDRNSLTSVKKSRSMRRALILAAVITALLSLCGFAAYKLPAKRKRAKGLGSLVVRFGLG